MVTEESCGHKWAPNIHTAMTAAIVQRSPFEPVHSEYAHGWHFVLITYMLQDLRISFLYYFSVVAHFVLIMHTSPISAFKFFSFWRVNRGGYHVECIEFVASIRVHHCHEKHFHSADTMHVQISGSSASTALLASLSAGRGTRGSSSNKSPRQIPSEFQLAGGPISVLTAIGYKCTAVHGRQAAKNNDGDVWRWTLGQLCVCVWIECFKRHRSHLNKTEKAAQLLLCYQKSVHCHHVHCT